MPTSVRLEVSRYPYSEKILEQNAVSQKSPTSIDLTGPSRRACLQGVAGFALAALGGLNQVAQAASSDSTAPTGQAAGQTKTRSSPLSGTTKWP